MVSYFKFLFRFPWCYFVARFCCLSCCERLAHKGVGEDISYSTTDCHLDW